MVFFNYATMQMAAKIVYYGPGLCGKTTNLHHIYGRTAPGSRGEMVSLETETDRTLFFDLLPLDVGVIGGFKTRVQLYTVPGQVFYNTTRKLVLKGVDGIVFVADSQRAMKEANIESLQNLRSNLAEIGVKLEDLPLVLQYNKRDLANILALEELEETLNPARAYESYEACAVLGQGVFETLKAISRLTLRSLKKRMLGEERPSARPTMVATVAERTTTPPAETEAPAIPEILQELSSVTERPKAAAPPPPPAPAPVEDELISLDDEPGLPAPAASPRETTSFDAGSAEAVQEFEDALASLDSPLPEEPRVTEETEIADVSFAQAPEPESVAVEDVKHVKVRSNIDILAELEKLRKDATAAPVSERPAKRQAPGVSIDDLLASSLNHRKEVSRIFELQVPRGELAGGHQVRVALRIEDREQNPVGDEKTFAIELHTRPDLEKLLLSLKFHIFAK